MPKDSWKLGAIIATIAVAGCTTPVEHGLAVPIPLSYTDGLLYAYGEALLSLDQRCGTDPGDSPPARSASPTVLIEMSNPLSVVSDQNGDAPQPFRHGQVQLNASQGGIQGSPRFLLCDVPLLRGNQVFSEYRLDRTAGNGQTVTTGPLGAVLGSDLFSRFALTFAFSGAGASMSANLLLQHSELKDNCFVDDAVLPFQPVGGDLKVQVGDSVVIYNPTLVTVAACVEPVADPFAYKPSAATVRSCIDRTKFSETDCAGLLGPNGEGLVELGNQVDLKGYRDPAYEPSGVNMRFLFSTSVPDLLISQTSCQRLDDGATRCDISKCPDAQKVKLRLPGLNGPVANTELNYLEEGCQIKLGRPGRAALALVTTKLHFGPCGELARSRRQRYALPHYSTPPFMVESPTECMRQACLQNLARESNLTTDRCAYTGMDVEKACDDHLAPVAAYVEMGGPSDDPSLPDDTIDAVVVPDSARVLQAANTDLRNSTAQVDGVIGVSLLSRLRTTVDYPQTRLVLVCRCGQGPAQVCRTYRDIGYHDEDPCVPSEILAVPPDFGRSACR